MLSAGDAERLMSNLQRYEDHTTARMALSALMYDCPAPATDPLARFNRPLREPPTGVTATAVGFDQPYTFTVADENWHFLYVTEPGYVRVFIGGGLANKVDIQVYALFDTMVNGSPAALPPEVIIHPWVYSGYVQPTGDSFAIVLNADFYSKFYIRVRPLPAFHDDQVVYALVAKMLPKAEVFAALFGQPEPVTAAIERNKCYAAAGDIGAFNSALALYQVDVGRYPGKLQQVVRDSAPGWSGPYMNAIPRDPWGNNYSYRSQAGDYTIQSIHVTADGSKTIRYNLDRGVSETLP